MKSVVDQAFGYVHRLYASFRLHSIAEDNFVHGRRGVRKIVSSFQPFANVIGVQHGIFRGLPQAIRPVRHDVSQRADEHSKVAVKRAHPAD